MKKPSHINSEPKDTDSEPDDDANQAVESIFRYPDYPTLAAAVFLGQRDIIESELEWLHQSIRWSRRADKQFEHTIGKSGSFQYEVPADLVEQTLAKCRLDNIPVFYTQLVEWPLLESVTETAVR